MRLGPHGLGVAPSADGSKLIITKKPATNEPESHLQKLHAKDISERLDRGHLGALVSGTSRPLEIKDQPLLSAFELLCRELDLPFAFDGKAIQDGKLDPTAKVGGKLGPGDLRTSLNEMLKPLGLTLEVRCEVVFVTPIEASR